MATTKKPEDLTPKFTIGGCAKVLTLITDFTHNPDTYGIENLRRHNLHIEAMAVNEILNERRVIRPKVKVLNVAVTRALEALNQDKAPNVITPALQKDIGLIKANVTAWEGVMAEIQEKREAKKA